MESDQPAPQIDIDLERTRMLALSSSVNVRMAEQEAQSQQALQNTQWNGEQIYNYMQQNRGARFEDTEEGLKNFGLMKEYMKSKNASLFSGFGEALGSMFEELSNIGKAPEVLFDPKKSLAVSAAEGTARGVRDIATIFWQSEDPNSWAFGLKSWVNALSGRDDGNLKSQMDQYHIAREWNDRTYDYMEGKETVLGDMFADGKDFFKRSVDPEFATAFSWVATDIPEWILSGGIASAGSAIKAAGKGGIRAGGVGGARALNKTSAYLAGQYDRISNFGKRLGGGAIESAGDAIQSPFKYLYGARATVEELAGSSAAAAGNNIASSLAMEGVQTVAGNVVKYPAIGIFRSLGIESIGEILSAYGSEMAERAMGRSMIDPNKVGMTVMDAVAANLGGKTRGTLSKEALALAKGVNFTVGWLPSMSSNALREATRNGVIGGALGWFHSEEAIGQGIAIGAAYGAGFGTVRHVIGYTHYNHQDGLAIKNFEESAIPAAARIHGEKTAQSMKAVLDYWKQRIAAGDGSETLRMAGVELSNLTHLLREGATASPSGAVKFWWGDATKAEGKADYANFLESVGWGKSEAAAEAEALSRGRGRFTEPMGHMFSSKKGRVIAVNSANYNGLTVAHEVSHAVLRAAAWKSGMIDENGLYTNEALKRFFGLDADLGVAPDSFYDLAGTTYYAWVGQQIKAPTPQPGALLATQTDRSYRSILNEELKNNNIGQGTEAAQQYELANLERIQREAYDYYKKGPNGVSDKSLMMQTLENFRTEMKSGGNVEYVDRANLSVLMDEIMAYTYGASSLGLPQDYWNKNKGVKDALRSLGEYMAERKHTRIIADMELAGVYAKEAFVKRAGKGGLLTESGDPLIQAWAFDDGKIVRIEALDEFIRGLMIESSDLTEQPVHTLNPAKQAVIAKMSGVERYFNPVPGGMRIKDEHERDAMALGEARKAISALEALPVADRPRIEVTNGGVSVKMEDMSQAAWQALEASGAYTQTEINQLHGMAKVIEDINAGRSPNNVFHCSLKAKTRQIGRGATSKRLKGDDVPITHRVFTPLSIELFVDDKTSDGRPAKSEKGGIRVHSFDILAENKRLIAMFEKPQVRQYFDSFKHFAEVFETYVANNSAPAGIRVPSADLLRAEFGNDAEKVRDIFFEAFGGRKPKDASYINTPNGEYKVPGDNRIYPFYTMRFDTMWDIELSPTNWNPNGTSAHFPYNHKLGYDPLTRNNMVTGFVEKPKANGSYMKNRDGFEIHEVKGKFRMYDPYGNKVGDFADLKRAFKMADKLVSKLKDEEKVPAAIDGAITTQNNPTPSTSIAREMVVGGGPKLSEGLREKFADGANGALNFIKANVAKGNYNISFADIVGDIPLIDVIHKDGRRIVATASDFGIRIIPSDQLEMSGEYVPRTSTGYGIATGFSAMGTSVSITTAAFDYLSKKGAEYVMQKMLERALMHFNETNLVARGDMPTASHSGRTVGSTAGMMSQVLGRSDKGIEAIAAEADFSNRASQLSMEEAFKAAQDTSEMDQLGVGLENLSKAEPNTVGPLAGGTENVDVEQTGGMREEHRQAWYGIGFNKKSSSALLSNLTKEGKFKGTYTPGMVRLLDSVSGSEGSRVMQFDVLQFVNDLNDSELEDLRLIIGDSYPDYLESAEGPVRAFDVKDKARIAAALADALVDTGAFSEGSLSSVYGRSSVQAIRRRMIQSVRLDSKGSQIYRNDSLKTKAGRNAASAISQDISYISFNRLWTTPLAIVPARVKDSLTGRPSIIKSKSQQPAGGGSMVISSANLNDRAVQRFYSMEHVEDLLANSTDPEEIADAMLLQHALSNKNNRAGHELLRYEGRTVRPDSKVTDLAAFYQMAKAPMQSWAKGDVPGQAVMAGDHVYSSYNLNSRKKQKVQGLLKSRSAVLMGAGTSMVELSFAIDPYGTQQGVSGTKWSSNPYGALHSSMFLAFPGFDLLKASVMRTGEFDPLNPKGSIRTREKKATTGPVYGRIDRSTGAMVDAPSFNQNNISVLQQMMLDKGVIPTLEHIKSLATKDRMATTGSIRHYVEAKFKGQNGQKLRSVIDGMKREMVQMGPDVGTSAAALIVLMDEAGINPVEHELMSAAVAYVAKTELFNPDLHPDVDPASISYKVSLQSSPVESQLKPFKSKISRTKLDFGAGIKEVTIDIHDEFFAVAEAAYKLEVIEGVSPVAGISLPGDLKDAIRSARGNLTDSSLKSAISDFKKTGAFMFVASPIESMGAGGYTTRDMVVGQAAIRKMHDMRREELLRRGLLKNLRTGAGANHLIYELADDRAQLNMRSFGGRIANIMLGRIGEDPAEVAKLWLALNGHTGLRDQYLQDFGIKGGVGRAYMPPQFIASLEQETLTNKLRERLEEITDKSNQGPHKWGSEGPLEQASLTLGDILDHPELFELYPNMASMPVRFHFGYQQFGMYFNGAAQKPHISMSLGLLLRDEIANLGLLNENSVFSAKVKPNFDQFTPSNGKYSYEASVRAILLHEMQHAIQHAEKWGMCCPWIANTVRGDKASGFGALVDQYVAVEKVLGGQKKTKILSNIDTAGGIKRSDIEDKLMRTWGGLQDIISLDMSTPDFAVIATEADAIGTLKSIIETPKAVKLLNTALPNYIQFLHGLAVNADIDIEIRRSNGDTDTPELERAQKARNLIADTIQKVEEIKQKVMSGDIPLNEAIGKLEGFDDRIRSIVPASMQDPIWSAKAGRRSMSAYNPFSDESVRSVEVAAQLAEMAASVEPGEVVSPAKAQLLIVKLMGELKDLFYSMSDTEFMARETQKRSLLSQTELEADPRRLDFFNAENVGMYEHAKWFDPVNRGSYSLEMVGGLAGSPEIVSTSGAGGTLNHFAAAIRMAARAALHGVHIKTISDAATKAGVFDFSSRGWVLQDGKLVYRISTGRFENAEAMREPLFAGTTEQGFVADQAGFSGMFYKDPEVSASMLGYLSRDGKNITVEDVGRIYGATVAYENMTDTESHVMNYLMKDDGPAEYVGGTIKNTLSLAGLSESSMRLANIDHIDKAFASVRLSRFELLDLLATVHDVTLESTSLTAADKSSVGINNLSLIKNNAEAGRRLWSAAKNDEMTEAAARTVLGEIIGSDEQSFLRASYNTEAMPGAMFMMSVMTAHLKFASSNVWKKFLQRMDQEQRIRFMERVRERVGEIQHYPRGGPGDDHSRMYVGLVRTIIAGDNEAAKEAASQKVDALNRHISGLLIALTPAADKLWRTLETRKLKGETIGPLETVFADVVADMIGGAMQGSDVWNIHLGERGRGTSTRYVSGLEQIYVGSRVDPGRQYQGIGDMPVGAPIRLNATDGGGYSAGFYKNIRKSAEELGSAVPTMITGGMPIHGTITGAAGDLYKQFATGTYIGSAFSGSMFPADTMSRLSQRGVYKDANFGELFARDVVTGADSEDLKIARQIAETSGIRTEYRSPLMTVHEGPEPLFQTPSLKEQGVAITRGYEPVFAPQDAEVPITDVIAVAPLLNLHVLSLAEIAAPLRQAGLGYESGTARAIDLNIPMALLEFRNAGLRLIDAAQQYLNFAETLRNTLTPNTSDIRTVELNMGFARSGDIAGSLDIGEITSLGDPIQVSDMLIKARAFNRLAHLINYRADDFGMMGMIPSTGSALSYLPYAWENARIGSVTETMSPDQAGFSLPTSNTSMVRGLIDDKSTPGSKTMLITSVSSIAEPPTSAEVHLVDSAFSRDAEKQKAIASAKISPIVRNISYDINTVFTGSDSTDYANYSVARSIFNSPNQGEARDAYDGNGGIAAPFARTLADFSTDVSYHPVAEEIAIRPSKLNRRAYATQIGFGHLTFALANAGHYSDSSKPMGPNLISNIRSHSDLATDMMRELSRGAPVQQLTLADVEKAWKTVYKGRRLKFDPRILIFARPLPELSSGNDNAHHQILKKFVPGYSEALNSANQTAVAFMATRHMRDVRGGRHPSLSPAEAIKLAGEQVDVAGMFEDDATQALLGHFINRDLATTDGFVRYNNLVGSIFLEKTLLKWLSGKDGEFLSHLENESRAQMIHALRHSGAVENTFLADPSALVGLGREITETTFGIENSDPQEIRNLLDSMRFLASTFQLNSENRMGARSDIPKAIKAMSEKDGVSVRRPMAMRDNEISWDLNDVLVRTGQTLSDDDAEVTFRLRKQPYTGNGFSFANNQIVKGGHAGPRIDNSAFLLLSPENLTAPDIRNAYTNRMIGAFGPRLGNKKEIMAHIEELRSITPETGVTDRAFVSGKVVKAKNGGMLLAMLSDSMTHEELVEDIKTLGKEPVITVTPKVPRTTVSESTARSMLHESIQSRIKAEGVDAVEIAPASSAYARVLPDVLQKRFQLSAGSAQKALNQSAVFSSRGMLATPKTMSRPYGEGAVTQVRRDDDAITPRLPSPVISGAPATASTLGGFANPFSLTGQPYHKGYAWNVQPDGSILLNISGDHLGYKTALLDDVWGFSLTEGVGFDPHSGALIPMRYDLHRDMSDILGRIKHAMTGYLDPHDPAIERARILAGRDYDKRPMSEIRMQMLTHSGFKEYHALAHTGDKQALTSRMAALDDPVNFGEDKRIMPEQTAAMIRGELRGDLPQSYRQQLVAAGVLGGLQTASYLTLKIPAGATPEMIKAIILSAHTDLAVQKAILGTGTTVPKFGIKMPYHMSYGQNNTTGQGRRFAGRDAADVNLLSATQGFGPFQQLNEAAYRANLEIALQADPKLIEDIEILVGRMASTKSSYFLPETERVLRVHGDTGAAIATLFPGRPDLEKFSWDAKASRDIKVWKRSIPRGANPDKFFQHVVQFNVPAGMTVDGAISLGPSAFAFRTAAEAEQFANRMSMQQSGSDLVKALSTGEAEVVARPQDMASGLVVPAKVIEGRTIIWDTPGRQDALMPSDVVGLKIGDSQLAPGTDMKAARAMASAIGKNKHIRFNAAPISLQMAMGLTTQRDFKDLVTSKANFGLPLGPARFASKAMQVITEGVLRANGAYRQFTELTGSDWLKLMKENGVSKDEIRQSGLGVLFLNAGSRKLNRTEVAEFFAHMYPVLVRNDFSVNERLRQSGRNYTGRGAAQRGYSFSSPDHVSVSIGNQMMALSQLEKRRQRLAVWLSSELEKGTPVDDDGVVAVKKALEGFEKVLDEIIAEHGESGQGYATAEDKVFALRGLIVKNTERFEGKIDEKAIIAQKAEDIRRLSFQPYEQARLRINQLLSSEVLVERHRESLGPLFEDLGPAIEHALTVRNTGLFTAEELKGLLRLNNDNAMKSTGDGIAYYDNTQLRKSISQGVYEGQGPRIGQFIGNNDYWHGHYVSGMVHSQSQLIVDFASTAEVEITQFINEKKTQYESMPEGPDKEKLEGIIKAAESVRVARMAQKALGENGRGIGSGHFGSHIGGLYSPIGRYEVGHLRQSHVLATGRPSLGGMIQGIGGIFFPVSKTPGLVDPLAKSSDIGLEPIAEPLTVIEEVQSDAFQKLEEVSEITTNKGSTMLPIEASDLDIAPRMAEAKRLAEEIKKLEATIEKGDDVVLTKLVEDIASARSSSFLNTVRKNAIESIDLVSRQYMAPQFPGMMRSTGRKVRMGDHMRKKLEQLGMKFPEGDVMVPVFEFDFELMDAVGKYANKGDHPRGAEADQIRSRIRENLSTAIDTFGGSALSQAGPQYTSLEAFDAAPSGVVFNGAVKVASDISTQVMAAAATQSSDAMTRILAGLHNAALAASQDTNGPKHLPKLINGVVKNMRSLSPVAQIQGVIAAVIATDPMLNAMLRQVAENPDSFDYESLARRSVEVIRAKFADSRGVLSRSALTTLDKMLLLPSQDGPRRGIIDIPSPVGEYVPRGNLTTSFDMISRGVRLRDVDTLALGLRNVVNTSLSHALIVESIEGTLKDYPNGRLLLPIQGHKGDAFRSAGTKDYFVLSYDNSGEVAQMVLDAIVNGAKNGLEIDTYTELENMLQMSNIALEQPYRGSMAGDMAKMVAHHLASYERTNDLNAKLKGLETKYAEKTKGLPKPAVDEDSAVSASTPFIDSELTWYKSTTINHAIIESINRGQRGVGLLDGAYQMSRGGSLQRSRNIRLSIGPGRKNVALTTGTDQTKRTNAVMALMYALQSADGEIKWDKDGFSNTVLKTNEALSGANVQFRGVGHNAATHVVRELLQMAVSRFGTETVEKLVKDSNLMSLAVDGERTRGLNLFVFSEDDYSSVDNMGPDGKPTKFTDRERAYKPFQQMANTSNLYVVPEGWRQGAIPVGYTLNYGLHQNVINVLFPGVSRKVTDIFNLDAFERPKVVTEGEFIVVYDKAGREVIRSNVAEMSSRKAMNALREAVLKNSKYVGGNIFVKTFLKEWGPAGGYVDAAVGGRGLKNTARQQVQETIISGVTLTFHPDQAMSKPLDPRGVEQFRRLEDLGIVDPNAWGDESHGVAIPEYSSGGESTRNNWTDGDPAQILSEAMGIPHETSTYLSTIPMFTVLNHTPMARTREELKFYADKIKSGVFLQMVTGTDALKRKDSVSMRKVARYLSAAGHIPRLRAEQEENETAY